MTRVSAPLRRLAALSFALASGCADLFPSEDTTSASSAGSPPAGPPVDPDPTLTQPDPVRGGMFVGNFYYRCSGDRDPACIGDQPRDFPAEIAVDGAFQLEYRADRGYILPITVANPDRLTYATGAFRALAPGPAALLVYEKDHIRDLLNLHFTAPTSIEIQRNQAEVLTLTLELGEEAALVAIARSDGGLALAGTLQYRWSVEGDSVTIVDEQGPGGIRLQATAPGEASLLLTLADFAVTVPVTVLGDAGGTSSTGASASTGDASSTGTTGGMP